MADRIQQVTAEEVSAIVRDMTLPAIQVYAGDWLRDAVSGCSLSTRGAWWEMLLVMHDARPYGHLVENGNAMREEAIARRCRCAPRELRRALAELDAAGVPRLTGTDDYAALLRATAKIDKGPHKGLLITFDLSPLGVPSAGVVYSRRMVKDQRLRVIRKIVGRYGGNPILVNQTSERDNQNTDTHAGVRADVVHLPSSVSFSDSLSDTTEEERKRIATSARTRALKVSSAERFDWLVEQVRKFENLAERTALRGRDYDREFFLTIGYTPAEWKRVREDAFAETA